jgi:hypothetical protein
MFLIEMIYEIVIIASIEKCTEKEYQVRRKPKIY